MKTKILILMLTILPFLGWSQSKIEQIIENYTGKEGYTTVFITSSMLQLFSQISDEQADPEIDQITSDLKHIKILTSSSTMMEEERKAFCNEILSALPGNVYKDLMVINENGHTVKFMIKQNEEFVEELLLVGEDEPVVILISGKINLKNIAKLSKTLDIEGLEHLEKVDEENQPE